MLPRPRTSGKSLAAWPASFVAFGAVAVLSNFDEMIAPSAIVPEVTFPAAMSGFP
jgi:hypothetical protein